MVGLDEGEEGEEGERKGQDSHRRAEHLFQDDSQMLDRSSRYNPTSRANGMILNKGSHPLKHDRSSPRYVVALRAIFGRLRTTTDTIETEKTENTFRRVSPPESCT